MELLDTKYKIKDEVYLKTDPDQLKRLITAIILREKDFSYELSCGTEKTWHFEYELDYEKTFQK